MEAIMARKSGRAALVLSNENRRKLLELAASRTTAVREVERAGVLLKYAEGLSISEIQRLAKRRTLAGITSMSAMALCPSWRAST
jgi:hypothetical protein